MVEAPRPRGAAATDFRPKRNTPPAEGRQWWVRPDWRPSPQQLDQARAWIGEGRPVPMYWYRWLGQDAQRRRGAA